MSLCLARIGRSYLVGHQLAMEDLAAVMPDPFDVDRQKIPREDRGAKIGPRL
jgi:hypothetical protein